MEEITSLEIKSKRTVATDIKTQISTPFKGELKNEEFFHKKYTAWN